MKRITWILTAASAFLLGWLFAPGADAQPPADTARFDQIVRNDFFAGFLGDKKALDRAMQIAEQTLAANPNHPEALAWHGAGLFARSGESFRAQDYAKGQELWTQAIAEMDRAVLLAPDQVGVRIPRGAPLLMVSRFVPEDRKKELLDRAKADYLHAYKLQERSFEKLSLHSQGELLLGIADALDRTEGFEQARPWIERASSLGDKVYAGAAKRWLETGTLDPMSRTCKGCHVEGR